VAANDDVTLTTGTLKFQFQDSSYDSPTERDQMLAYAVVAFQVSAAECCQNTQFTFYSDHTDGCTLPSRRDGMTLPPQGNPQPVHPPKCFKQMPICSGPDHISKYVLASALLASTNVNNVLDVELGGSSSPYAKHVDFSVSFHLDGDPAYGIFVCEVALKD